MAPLPCSWCPQNNPFLLSIPTAVALRSQVHCHLFAWDVATVSKWSPCLQSCPFHSILYTERFFSKVSLTKIKALWWSLNSGAQPRPLWPASRFTPLPTGPGASIHTASRFSLQALLLVCSAFTGNFILPSYLFNSFNNYLLRGYYVLASILGEGTPEANSIGRVSNQMVLYLGNKS